MLGGGPEAWTEGVDSGLSAFMKVSMSNVNDVDVRAGVVEGQGAGGAEGQAVSPSLRLGKVFCLSTHKLFLLKVFWVKGFSVFKLSSKWNSQSDKIVSNSF